MKHLNLIAIIMLCLIIPGCSNIVTTPKVATPTFSPVAGTYATDQTVTISTTTSGATIYYTTNGDTPTTSSSMYSSPISIAGNGTSKTIKAIAVKTGMTNSDVASASYTINYSKVATPTFSPAAGTYTTDQTVTTSTTTSGATIYYTTNGDTPTTSSSVYSSPISIAGNGTSMTIKAIAVKTGMTNSDVASASYQIKYRFSVKSYSISESILDQSAIIYGEVENAGTQGASFVKVNYVLKDASNQILASSYTYVDPSTIPASKTYPFIEYTDVKKILISSVDFSISYYDDTYKDPEENLLVQSSSISTDYYGYIEVSGKIKNTGSQALEYVKCHIIFYDSEGKVVYIDSGYASPSTIVAGDTNDFSCNTLIKPLDYSTYKIFATSSSNY